MKGGRKGRGGEGGRSESGEERRGQERKGGEKRRELPKAAQTGGEEQKEE